MSRWCTLADISFVFADPYRRSQLSVCLLRSTVLSNIARNLYSRSVTYKNQLCLLHKIGTQHLIKHGPIVAWWPSHCYYFFSFPYCVVSSLCTSLAFWSAVESWHSLRPTYIKVISRLLILCLTVFYNLLVVFVSSACRLLTLCALVHTKPCVVFFLSAHLKLP